MAEIDINKLHPFGCTKCVSIDYLFVGHPTFAKTLKEQKTYVCMKCRTPEGKMNEISEELINKLIAHKNKQRAGIPYEEIHEFTAQGRELLDEICKELGVAPWGWLHE